MDLATAKGVDRKGLRSDRGTEPGGLRARSRTRTRSLREVCLIGGSEAEGGGLVAGMDLRRGGRMYRVASRLESRAGVAYLHLEPAASRN